MPEWMVFALLAAAALNVGLLLWLALRPRERGAEAQIERLERELRDELGRQGLGTRADLAQFQQMLLTRSGDVARTQNDQIDSFRTQLAKMQQASEGTLRRLNETLVEQLQKLAEANERRGAEMRQAVGL